MQKKFSKEENQARFQQSIKYFPESDEEWAYSDKVIMECPEWQRIMKPESRSLKEMIHLANNLSYMSRMILDEISDGMFERE